MEYITVKSQAELDAVPVDSDKIIRIEFGTDDEPAIVKMKYKYTVNAYNNSSVVAYDSSRVRAYDNSRVETHNNSSVETYDNSSVVAYDNSSVVAYGNSSVVAYGNSSVEAYDNSRVETHNNSSVETYNNSSVVAYDSSRVRAYDNSRVETHNNSSVVAYGNSSVVAYGNSRVEAYENSRVEAYDNSRVMVHGNVQVTDYNIAHTTIQTFGNARRVHMPINIDEYLNFYNIPHDEDMAVLYKAVHKINDKYVSNYDKSFEYIIGEKKCSDTFNDNPDDDCGAGINVSTLHWALDFGKDWDDIAILELKVRIKDILLPEISNGKVRVPKAKVIREVPFEDCGLMGEFILKRRKNNGT